MQIKTDIGVWHLDDLKMATVCFSFTDSLRGFAGLGLTAVVEQNREALADLVYVHTEETRVGTVNNLLSFYARPGSYWFERKDVDEQSPEVDR